MPLNASDSSQYWVLCCMHVVKSRLLCCLSSFVCLVPVSVFLCSCLCHPQTRIDIALVLQFRFDMITTENTHAILIAYPFSEVRTSERQHPSSIGDRHMFSTGSSLRGRDMNHRIEALLSFSTQLLGTVLLRWFFRIPRSSPFVLVGGYEK